MSSRSGCVIIRFKVKGFFVACRIIGKAGTRYATRFACLYEVMTGTVNKMRAKSRKLRNVSEPRRQSEPRLTGYIECLRQWLEISCPRRFCRWTLLEFVLLSEQRYGLEDNQTSNRSFTILILLAFLLGMVPIKGRTRLVAK
jgi:hypothetical protein